MGILVWSNVVLDGCILVQQTKPDFYSRVCILLCLVCINFISFLNSSQLSEDRKCLQKMTETAYTDVCLKINAMNYIKVNQNFGSHTVFISYVKHGRLRIHWKV